MGRDTVHELDCWAFQVISVGNDHVNEDKLGNEEVRATDTREKGKGKRVRKSRMRNA